MLIPYKNKKDLGCVIKFILTVLALMLTIYGVLDTSDIEATHDMQKDIGERLDEINSRLSEKES